MAITLAKKVRTYATLYRTVQQRVPSALERTPSPWAAPEPTWEEKRESERLRYPLFAMVQTIRLVPSETVPVRVLDISAEGIGLITSHALPINTVLGLEIQSATGEPQCRVRAQVRHSTIRADKQFLVGCVIVGESTVPD